MNSDLKIKLLNEITNTIVENYEIIKKTNDDVNLYLNEHDVNGYKYNDFCAIILKKFDDYFNTIPIDSNESIQIDLKKQTIIILESLITDKTKT